MVEDEILRELFDDKIIDVITVFISSPEKQFYLTEVSNISKVNMTSTFRILNRLVDAGYVKAKVIGKVRIYQLEISEKTRALTKLLKKDSSPLQEFINQVSEHPRIKKIILENSQKDNSKIIIVGDFLPRSRIHKACEDIKVKYNFKIDFVELSEKQFEDMKKIGIYDLDKKVIWERNKNDKLK